MPFITFEGPHMDKETKARIVRELTETASKILNIPPRAFSILIKENSADNIGLGGELLSNQKRE